MRKPIERKEHWKTRRGRAGAAERWRLDGIRRDALAAADPVKFTGKIVRRVIVIENESTVREVAVYDFDSCREARRRIGRLGL